MFTFFLLVTIYCWGTFLPASKQERVTYFSTHAIYIGPVLWNTEYWILNIDLSFEVLKEKYIFSRLKDSQTIDEEYIQVCTLYSVHCKVCINFINKPWYHRFLQGDISYDITLWPGVLNFQIRFVNGSNSVLLPITCTFKALKTFLPELLPFNFLFCFLMTRLFKKMCVCDPLMWEHKIFYISSGFWPKSNDMILELEYAETNSNSEQRTRAMDNLLIYYFIFSCLNFVRREYFSWVGKYWALTRGGGSAK